MWKVSKYRVISGPYFPVFRMNTETCSVNLSSNTGKYGLEKIPYLDTIHAVLMKSWIDSTRNFVCLFYIHSKCLNLSINYAERILGFEQMFFAYVLHKCSSR